MMARRQQGRILLVEQGAEATDIEIMPAVRVPDGDMVFAQHLHQVPGAIVKHGQSAHHRKRGLRSVEGGKHSQQNRHHEAE